VEDAEPFDLWDDIWDRYRFDDCCIEAFEAVMLAWALHLCKGAGADVVRDAARALGHGDLAPAVAEALLDEAPDSGQQAGAFVDVLVGGASTSHAGPHLLRALFALEQGRVLDAEADLTEAVRRDGDWPRACLELAQLTNIRGDADRTVKLLLAAGLPPTSDEVKKLRRYTETAPADVGRNEPCPCGSGRKFKQCHLGQPVDLPIERRSAWLIGKVAAEVNASRATVGLASSAVEPWADAEPELFMDRFRDFIDDPFLADLAMVDGGGLEDFLDLYGALLPDDELELAEAWLESPRRLWEVTAVDEGTSLTLRDTSTGDEVVVTERTGSAGVDVGEYRLAIVVPVGAEHQFLSIPLPIDLRHREAVLGLVDHRADADSFAQWYGWASAPPTLTNREGEAMRPTRMRVTPSLDWPTFAAALDARYPDEVPTVPSDLADRWIEHHDVDGDQIVRAQLDREGDDLVVDTNSEERWLRVEETLRAIDPGITVTEEPIGREPGGLESIDTSPMAQAALLEHILAAEERWLDEEIPALGGATPREAADDPTRREDLRALLRSFPPVTIEGAMGFDADRLRAALGLEPE